PTYHVQTNQEFFQLEPTWIGHLLEQRQPVLDKLQNFPRPSVILKVVCAGHFLEHCEEWGYYAASFHPQQGRSVLVGECQIERFKQRNVPRGSVSKQVGKIKCNGLKEDTAYMCI